MARGGFNLILLGCVLTHLGCSGFSFKSRGSVQNTTFNCQNSTDPNCGAVTPDDPPFTKVDPSGPIQIRSGECAGYTTTWTAATDGTINDTLVYNNNTYYPLVISSSLTDELLPGPAGFYSDANCTVPAPNGFPVVVSGTTATAHYYVKDDVTESLSILTSSVDGQDYGFFLEILNDSRAALVLGYSTQGTDTSDVISGSTILNSWGLTADPLTETAQTLTYTLTNLGNLPARNIVIQISDPAKIGNLTYSSSTCGTELDVNQTCNITITAGTTLVAGDENLLVTFSNNPDENGSTSDQSSLTFDFFDDFVDSSSN